MTMSTTLYSLVIIVPVLAIILLLVNALLSVARPDTEKVTTYECGYDASRGQTRAPFSISFYLVAVLFLAFDLEVATLIPLAPSLGHVELYGFWVAVIFFLVLTLGFVVEVASGVLNITDQRSAITSVSLMSSSDNSGSLTSKIEAKEQSKLV
jgi:NADH:ubiquinone oxidoreductase subunit 3 (subunit A)